MSDKPIRVIVWDENPHHAPKEIYPKNIRGAISDGLRELGGTGIEVIEANLDDPDQGITAERLANADVLIWWGHARHDEVKDSIAALVKKAVHEDGLGFIPLHSAHYSKTFKAVCDCTGDLKGGWREGADDTEEITVCAPKHPVAEGVDDFVLAEEEMYGAPFGAPSPLVVVFQSYFPVGGEYFPSFAVTVGTGIKEEFRCGGGGGENQGEGAGRVFYFRPGHEAFPTYFDKNVRRVIYNAVNWAARKK